MRCQVGVVLPGGGRSPNRWLHCGRQLRSGAGGAYPDADRNAGGRCPALHHDRACARHLDQSAAVDRWSAQCPVPTPHVGSHQPLLSGLESGRPRWGELPVIPWLKPECFGSSQSRGSLVSAMGDGAPLGRLSRVFQPGIGLEKEIGLQDLFAVKAGMEGGCEGS